MNTNLSSTICMPILTAEVASPMYAETLLIAALPSTQESPYPNSFVVTATNHPTNAHDPIAQLQFSTSRPKSYYTIELQGFGQIYSAPMDHPNGIQGGQLNVMMGGKTHPIGAGTVTFSMYTDFTKVTLLCRATGTYNRTTNTLSINGASTCNGASSSSSSNVSSMSSSSSKLSSSSSSVPVSSSSSSVSSVSSSSSKLSSSSSSLPVSSSSSSTQSSANTLTSEEAAQVSPYMNHINSLRTQYGFKATDITLEYNKKGAKEKWWYGSDGTAFHILPDGSVWKGVTPNRTGLLLAAFPKVVYDNAELLFVTVASSSSSTSISSVSSVSSSKSSSSSSVSTTSSSVSSSSTSSVSSSSSVSSGTSSSTSSSSSLTDPQTPPPPSYKDPVETIVGSGGLTRAQEALERFSAIKDQVSTMLVRLNGQITATSAHKKFLADEMLIAQKALSDATALLQKAEQERQASSVGVTPYVEANVKYFEKFVKITYTNAAQGMRVALNGDNFTALPVGSGEIQIPIPYSSVKVVMDVEVYDGTGKHVADLITFYAWLSYARTGAANGKSFPELRYTLSGGTVTAEQEAAAKLQKEEAERLIAQLSEQAILTDQSLQKIQEDANAVERDKIPYPRMYVEAINHPEQLVTPHFSVRYMSNEPQTYFEVELTGQNIIHRQTISHPAGTEDRTVGFTIGQNERGSYGHGNVYIRMYADATKERLLAQYTGFYDRNAYTVEDASTQVPWGTMETGRMGERILDTNLGVIALKGPNVLFFMQTPYDHSRVEIDGGGMFSIRQLEHVSGTSAEPISLTFNGTKPSGEYAVRLTNGAGGMELDRVMLRWNASTKSLSLVNEDDRTDTLDPALTQAAELFARQTSLSSIDVSGTSLRDIQGIELYQKSRFFIPGSDIEKYVRAAYPQYFPVDQAKYIQEEAIRQNKQPGQIQDWLVRTQLDLISVARSNLGVYENLMGQIMENAVEVVVAVKNASGEPAARTTLQDSITFAANHLRIREINRIGVYIPSFDDTLTEGIRLFNSELDTLLARQNVMVTLREEELNKYVKIDTDTGPNLISSNAFLGRVRTIEAAYEGNPEGLKNALNNYYLSRAREYLEYYGITPDPSIDARTQVAFMLGVTPVVARAGEYADWEQSRFSEYERELTELREEWEALIAEYGDEANTLAREWMLNGDAVLDAATLATADTQLMNSGELFTSTFLDQNVTHTFSEEWQSLYRAKHAKTVEERQRFLLEGNFADEVKGNGTKPGTLVVLINGHLQHIGEDPNKSGIETAKKVLSGQGYDILHFRVGTAVFPISNVQALSEVSELLLLDRIARIGIFENRSPVDRIIVAGYSWGGGTAVNFVDRIKNSTQFAHIPVDLAVIDAVKLGEQYLAQPVTSRPNALRVFNRYQENDLAKHFIENKYTSPTRLFGTALLNVMTKGFPARGSLLFGKTHPQDDQKSVGVDYNHLSIDDGGIGNPIVQSMLEFIEGILE